MIICADFDGTIYFRNDEQQTAANFAAIEKWRQAGHVFVLATNRGMGSVSRVLPDWKEYFDFLILDSGGKIINAKSELIWANTFEPETLKRMLAVAENSETKPKIAFYGAENDDFTLEMPNSPLTKIRFWFKNDAEAISFAPKEINSRAFVWSHDTTFCWSPTDTFKGYYAVVDVAPEATNKAVAVRSLLKTQGLPEPVITVGDNINDFEMLKEFDGYAIEISKIATLHPELRTTKSVAELVMEKLQRVQNQDSLS